MIRILKFFFTGYWHSHKWETVEEIEMVDEDGSTVGALRVQKCSQCGKLQEFKTFA